MKKNIEKLNTNNKTRLEFLLVSLQKGLSVVMNTVAIDIVTTSLQDVKQIEKELITSKAPERGRRTMRVYTFHELPYAAQLQAHKHCLAEFGIDFTEPKNQKDPEFLFFESGVLINDDW